MSEITTITSRTSVPGEVKKVLKEGTITYSMVIMCSATAVVMVIPCWRNCFLFFKVTAAISKTKTVIWRAKLTVASVKETMAITRILSL